jgi:DNA gyrase subunit A
MVAIADGKPKQLGLIDIIKYYVQYQIKVILRRTRFDLSSAKERCHILEGLIIAVKNIDEVVAIIKSSDNVNDAKQKLRNRFGLSDRQAQAILDLRLARLTKLEVYKLEEELASLKALIEKLQAVIDNKNLQFDIIKDELKEIKKQYKSERRTQIVKSADEIKIERYDDVKPVVSCVLAIQPRAISSL